MICFTISSVNGEKCGANQIAAMASSTEAASAEAMAVSVDALLLVRNG